MTNNAWVRWLLVSTAGVALAVLQAGCKKDESNPVTPGAGLATFNFTTAGQVFNISGSGASNAKLTGGTLPYSITAPPNASVATASLSNDTLTVTPVAAGTTAITITDSNPANKDDPPRVVTIVITISAGAYGFGIVTASSTAGNLSISGSGVWPPGGGPSVLAVYDTVSNALVFLAYRQVSGPHYDVILGGIALPSGLTTGNFLVGDAAYLAVGYDVDTSHVDTTAYIGETGHIAITSVNGSNVQGSFSGTATKGSGQPITMTSTFNVSVVRGRSPIMIEGINTTPQYGSGTMTTNSSAGPLSFAGQGVWPPGAGPSVVAVYDTIAHELVVLGYQRVSGPHYNFELVAVSLPSGVTAGTYPVTTTTGFQVGYNADTSSSNNSYESVSGNIIIGSVNAGTASGSFSGQASLGGGTPIQFAGTFSVTYARGISPIGIGTAARPGLKPRLHRRMISGLRPMIHLH